MQNDAPTCAAPQGYERWKGRGINCFARNGAVARHAALVSKRIKRPLLYH